ncbi:MAG: hypothetical protein P8L68_01595 [Paracoccaceae bacterium]|nr:hypothetical protein [Paracoccaceae bacterium]MDG2257170.1 hypothetical protein [Paracoccaceae bacterium]
MARDEIKVACRTPTPGRKGVTNIPQWRFDMIRRAIIEVIATDEVRFADLPDLVRERLSEMDRDRLGSIGWNVTTVKLEMEVRGEVIRVEDKGPQRLVLAGKVQL